MQQSKDHQCVILAAFKLITGEHSRLVEMMSFKC